MGGQEAVQSVIRVGLIPVVRRIDGRVNLPVNATADVVVSVVRPIDVRCPTEAFPVLVNDSAESIESGVSSRGPLKMVESERGLRIGGQG